MSEQKKAKKETAAPAEQEGTQPESLEEAGDRIERELDRIDEMVEEALGEHEADAEKKAQEFVDGFKQKGGQ
ncbi:MAG TPA: ubiquitin [Acidobacteriota bacterium]